MRILNALTLTILTLLSPTSSLDLVLEYYADYWTALNTVVTSPDTEITSVDGQSFPADTKKLLDFPSQTMHYFPSNFARFFPKLTQLTITDSSLKWIEQANIKELTDLKYLYLDFNHLEILEEGLFDFNVKLEVVTVINNRLKFVHKDIFSKLSNLRHVGLKENECYEGESSTKADYFSVPNVVERLKDHCQSLRVIHKSSEDMKFKINGLESDNVQLIHQLETCDGNFDAALANFRQQKSMNSNADFVAKTKESVVLKLLCEVNECNATDFKVTFANSFIESMSNVKEITDLKQLIGRTGAQFLRIHRQQTLFLPINLFDFRIFQHLKELWVVESGLCEIDQNIFGRLDLLGLHLSKNKIFEVPADTFAKLTSLRELDLSFNNIHTLHDNTFASSMDLRKLYLNNNHLTVITGELFKNLDNLNVLSLQNNHLKYIVATLFRSMTNLESLDLLGNVCIGMSHPTTSLTDIHGTIIENCIAPVELKCKRDELPEYCIVDGLVIEYAETSISKLTGGGGEVEGLKDTVKVLVANTESIKFFPHLLAKQLPNLEQIEVQHSKLTSLHRLDFYGFTKLTKIVMSNNYLTYIVVETFDTVPQLELLDLSSNNIGSLPPNCFSKLASLNTLLLSNNQIVRLTADILPPTNVIEIFRMDSNQLEFIEPKSIRYLRTANIIDFTSNVCIDAKVDKYVNPNQTLVELSGKVVVNCFTEE